MHLHAASGYLIDEPAFAETLSQRRQNAVDHSAGFLRVGRNRKKESMSLAQSIQAVWSEYGQRVVEKSVIDNR